MPQPHDLSGIGNGHLSDADRLMDCLASAKERAAMYAAAALESTNNGVREFFLAMQNEETHNHEILFSFLHTRGFYPTEMVSQEQIDEVKQRYRTIHDQMGMTDRPSVRRYKTADPQRHPAQLTNPDHYEPHDNRD